MELAGTRFIHMPPPPPQQLSNQKKISETIFKILDKNER